MFETKCRCGAVKLRITGEPVVQLFCHCQDCQAAHDAAYAAAAIYPAASVEVIAGEPRPQVIRATPRMRCADCHTHLFSEIAAAGVRSVNAYLLPEGVFQPQFHVQCAHAMRPVVDDLPHYRGFPPAFGGRDEFVAW